MPVKSKNIQPVILGVMSVICSRTMFVFIDDPEGPNLLVVTVLAIVVYFLSLGVSLLIPASAVSVHLKKVVFSIAVPIVVVTGLYFCLQ